MEFDPGPSPEFAALFENLPDHTRWPDRFRLNWGPIYYRGRTDGSARVLVVGQDAASEEDVARRCFVGSAGRRLQGFLSKAGLTRSYVIINAFTFSVFGQFDRELREISEDPEMVAYRNALFDLAANGNLEAVVAFGRAAHHAVDQWPGAAGLFVAKPNHPSARPAKKLLANWAEWLPRVRDAVTPDDDGDPSSPNYGDAFGDEEQPPIPRCDLPFGMPAWFGSKNLKTARRDGTDVIRWKTPANSVG